MRSVSVILVCFGLLAISGCGGRDVPPSERSGALNGRDPEEPPRTVMRLADVTVAPSGQRVGDAPPDEPQSARPGERLVVEGSFRVRADGDFVPPAATVEIVGRGPRGDPLIEDSFSLFPEEDDDGRLTYRAPLTAPPQPGTYQIQTLLGEAREPAQSATLNVR